MITSALACAFAKLLPTARAMPSTPAVRALRRARNAIGSGKKFHARGKNKDLIQKILNKSFKKRLKGKQPPPVLKVQFFERGSRATVTEAKTRVQGRALTPALQGKGPIVASECIGFGNFVLDFIDRRCEHLDGEERRNVQIFQNLVDNAVKIWMAKTPGEKQTHVDAHYDAVNALHWASVLSDACRGAPNVTPELVVKPEHLGAAPPAWVTKPSQ